jgi:hypothetical protein
MPDYYFFFDTYFLSVILEEFKDIELSFVSITNIMLKKRASQLKAIL